MASKPKPSIFRFLDHCRVSPKPNPNIRILTSLPLTFLDIPWLLFPPSQPIFFYQNPFFDSTTIQTLKRSLSLALGLFYPLAGTLFLPSSGPQTPAILCGGADDSVSFTVAESDGNFDSLSSHCLQRDAAEFHKLVPRLNYHARAARADNVVPLLAVQVTVFPSAGFCLGLAVHHVAADARTFNNFMRVWSSFAREDGSSLITVDHRTVGPWFDRTVIVDAQGLEGVFLKEWRKRVKQSYSSTKGVKTLEEKKIEKEEEKIAIVSSSSRGRTIIEINDNVVRATFLVGPCDMERLKSWIVMAQCKKRSEPQSLHLSPYVLTCALLWVCLAKAQTLAQEDTCTDPNYFGFIAGGLTRMGYPVPAGYFGNCVGFGRAAAAKEELLGEDGILVAARAIGGTVKRLDKAMFVGSEKWIAEWEELIGSGVHIVVSGSPKVDLYERDFGWGRPKKIEEVEIDSTKGISLSESRDVKGGIEIGLVLPKPQMDSFTIFFEECFETLSSSYLLS